MTPQQLVPSLFRTRVIAWAAAVLGSLGIAADATAAFNPINDILVSDFTVFVQGDMAFGGHVHGATAIGGDLRLTSGNVEFGHEKAGNFKVAATDPFFTTLVVGGGFDTTSTGTAKLQNNGWMTLGQTAGTHLWDENTYTRDTLNHWTTEPDSPIRFKITKEGSAFHSQPSISANVAQAATYITRNSGIDFGAQFSSLRSSSNLVASLADSRQTRSDAYTWNGTALSINLGAGYTLIDLTASQFASISQVSINGTLSSTSSVIFDVSGSTVNFGNWNLQDKGEGASPYVLFNFAEATSVSLGAQLLYGSVLAPNALVTRADSSQNFSGQIIAAGFSQVGTSEIHYYPLDVQVPEPTAYASLFGVAGLCLAVWRRRSPSRIARR